MKCPACGVPDLDLRRAKNHSETYGSRVHRVSAPCCGAALRVECRVVVMATVAVDPAPESNHDDWGFAYSKRHRTYTEPA